MSRILDALAKADVKRRQNVIQSTLNGGRFAEEDLGKRAFRGDEWKGIAESNYQLGALTRRPERRSLHYFYTAGLVVALGTGMILGRYQEANDLSKRLGQDRIKAATFSKPVLVHPSRALAVKGYLPSCIPLEAEDVGYSSGHPGWQRYLTGSTEFRVFREGDSIKAIQARALQKEPLPGWVLEAFIGRIPGKPLCNIVSKEKKAGYQIEKSRLANQVEIVTYRKIPTDELRAAVVVYLPS